MRCHTCHKIFCLVLALHGNSGKSSLSPIRKRAAHAGSGEPQFSQNCVPMGFTVKHLGQSLRTLGAGPLVATTGGESKARDPTDMVRRVCAARIRALITEIA